MNAVLALFFLVCYTSKGQSSCTSGFPTVSDIIQCANNTNCQKGFKEDDNRRTRIIPALRITCNGTLTSMTYRARVVNYDDSSDPWFLVLRETELSTYTVVGEISGCPDRDSALQIVHVDNVYKCTLSEADRTAVKAGDVFGIALRNTRNIDFQIYFDSTPGSNVLPMNYVFTGRLGTDKSVSLCDAETSEMDQALPLIHYEIVPDTESTTIPEPVTLPTKIGCTIPLPTTTNTSHPATSPTTDEPTTLSTTSEVISSNTSSSRRNNTIMLAAILSVIAVLLCGILVVLTVGYLRRRKHSSQHKMSQIRMKTNHNYVSVNHDALQESMIDYQNMDNVKSPALPTSSRPSIQTETVSQQRASSSNGSTQHYEWGFYVPSGERRLSLSIRFQNIVNHDDYEQVETHKEPDNYYQFPSEFFEECEKFWEPSSNPDELYEQLNTNKYREILHTQIQVSHQLGAGQFGTVHKGVWQSPMGAMEIAVKTLHSGATEEEKVKFLQEAAINGQFRHPNVVKLMGVVTLHEPAMIILELLSNGDLREHLIKMRPQEGEQPPADLPNMLLKYCQQVASGMEYLSRKGFVHRDLAARNILVANDNTCKISDFGMCRDLMDEDYYRSHGGHVPVKWTAPEALHYKKYSTASDVWSYGCVMYEIWSLGHKPFSNTSNLEALQIVDQGYRLPPPSGCSKELYKIMIQCWHPNADNRPSFTHLIEVLCGPEFELLMCESGEAGSGTPVGVIGGSLDSGKNLYTELQTLYLNNS